MMKSVVLGLMLSSFCASSIVSKSIQVLEEGKHVRKSPYLYTENSNKNLHGDLKILSSMEKPKQLARSKEFARRDLNSYRIPRRKPHLKSGRMYDGRLNNEVDEVNVLLLFKGRCSYIRHVPRLKLIQRVTLGMMRIDQLTNQISNEDLKIISVSCIDILRVNVSVPEMKLRQFLTSSLYLEGKGISIRGNEYKFIKLLTLPRKSNSINPNADQDPLFYLVRFLYFSAGASVLVFISVIFHYCLSSCCNSKSNTASISRRYEIEDLPKFLRTGNQNVQYRNNVCASLPAELQRLSAEEQKTEEVGVVESEFDSEWSSDVFTDNIEFMSPEQNGRSETSPIAKGEIKEEPGKRENDWSDEKVTLYQCQSLNEGCDESVKDTTDDEILEERVTKDLNSQSVTRVKYDDKNYGFSFETDM